MVSSFFLLLAVQLVGEVAREVLGVPIPGPVLGMFGLALFLIARQTLTSKTVSASLSHTSETLIGQMGLMFVPAGVGLVAQGPLLAREWLPLVAGVVGSTVIGVVVTGAVMHWTLPAVEEDADASRS
ncbi:CidA/LrgA family protein [Pararhodospirillum photometricum]|uniref:LrgA n=1 Tax=Pararhodospirillum photometricum DSM 122 TaxID=1150469 RepID=H6SKQ8_PARPM|nr:CidA/LrgA family protein [Pararhodospirillum photometricum]CCG08573.1 LrgA [Pararhodospirillum photometricum DSM 122]